MFGFLLSLEITEKEASELLVTDSTMLLHSSINLNYFYVGKCKVIIIIIMYEKYVDRGK